MRLSHFLFAATLSVSPLALTVEAYAFDSTKFIGQLEALLEADGIDVTYGEIETQGDTLIINDFSIDDHKTSTGSKFETLSFTNPEESDAGEFSYDGISGTNFSRTGKNGSKVEIESITSTGLKFSDSSDGIPVPDLVESIKATNIKLSSETKPERGSITIPSVSASGFERTSVRNFKMANATIAPFSGRLFNQQGDPLDMSFTGASVSDFEYFGLFGLDIGKIEFGSIVINTTGEDGPINIAFEGMEMQNYYAWDPSDETRNLIPDADLTFEMKPLDIKVAGKTALSWKGAKGIAVNDAENLTSESTMGFSAITLDTTAIKKNAENKRALETLQSLGYEQITMNMALKGGMDLKAGILDIEKVLFDFADAGSFDMAFKVSGYTEQVAKGIAKAASDLSTNTDPKAQQAMSLQMLALFAPLSIQTMELGVTDASLLNKILTFQAGQSNRSPEELSAIVPPLAGIALAPLQVPELAAAITGALGTFMQGNKTIRASIEPEGGLAMTEMLALGSGVQSGSIPPAQLVERLNLNVVAE